MSLVGQVTFAVSRAAACDTDWPLVGGLLIIRIVHSVVGSTDQDSS